MKSHQSSFRCVKVLLCFAVVGIALTLISPRRASAQALGIKIEQFDQWIFSSMQNPEIARRKLNDRVEMEIQRITLTTELREPQKVKIRFAAKGDINRFFADVEQARRAFKTMQAAGEVNQQNINNVHRLAMPLQRRLNGGLFDKDSLLQKVARGSVDQLQAEELREREARLNKMRTEAVVSAVIANLGRQIPMLDTQRQQLSALLTDKVSIKDPSNRFATHVVLFQMSELPDKKLKAIFDKAQLDALHKNVDQAAAMKQQLKQMGLLDE